jgi:hypothetical protein
MTTGDVFSKISARMIEGMMLHDKMANYYDFLGLMGFKRMHEYHFLCDAVEMRCVNRYYINHYNLLLSESTVSEPFSIPASWYGHVRRDVGPSNKRSSIKSAMETWCDWQKETKKLYETCYRDLCDMDEIAAACKVKELVTCADMTLKCVDRLTLKLHSMDYDLPTILLMQADIHSEYDEKEKEIGVSIC